jgi:hypothetical protein
MTGRSSRLDYGCAGKPVAATGVTKPIEPLEEFNERED